MCVEFFLSFTHDFTLLYFLHTTIQNFNVFHTDRAAGKTAYVIEDNLNGVTGTIDKTLPNVLEAGRQFAESTSQLAKAAEYVAQDVAGFVDDVKVDSTINTASKRFAATKPVIQEMTTSAFDPNQNQKL